MNPTCSGPFEVGNGKFHHGAPFKMPNLITGGGNQFGIIVDFTVKAYPSRGPTTLGALGYPGTELANVIQAVKVCQSPQPLHQTWTLTHSLQKFNAVQTPGQWVIMTFARAPPEFYVTTNDDYMSNFHIDPRCSPVY